MPHPGQLASTRDAIATALRIAGGNKAEAARALGMTRDGVEKAVRRHKLRGLVVTARREAKRNLRPCPTCEGRGVVEEK